MYRAVVYHALYKNDPDAIRLTSEQRNTRQEAEKLLDRLLAHTPHITGGDIEVHVPRIGWVVADGTEEESMVLIARRAENCIAHEQATCLCDTCS